MPKIQEMLLTLEWFQYYTSLELNMGYHPIRILENKINIFIIIISRGKYKCKELPMGVSNSLIFFQGKSNETFQGF